MSLLRSRIRRNQTNREKEEKRQAMDNNNNQFTYDLELMLILLLFVLCFPLHTHTTIFQQARKVKYRTQNNDVTQMNILRVAWLSIADERIDGTTQFRVILSGTKMTIRTTKFLENFGFRSTTLLTEKTSTVK